MIGEARLARDAGQIFNPAGSNAVELFAAAANAYPDNDELAAEFDAVHSVDRAREVGSIVVAIGLDVYDPTEMDEYGYTRFDNVITSMEFERLICAGGPTAGHFVRPGGLPDASGSQ